MVAIKSSKQKDEPGLKMALIKEVKKFACLNDDAQPTINAAQRANCWAMICGAVGVKERGVEEPARLVPALPPAGGRRQTVVWEFWQTMAWYAPFQPLDQDDQDVPPQKKMKQEEAPSSNVPSDDELDVGEPQQQQEADAVEEVIYAETTAPDARMEEPRTDRNIPAEMQDEAWAAICGVLKEFEEKAKRDAAPTLAEATGFDPFMPASLF
ncbi:hypothetical protein AAVH_27744 [Aphelenchoides avenae]|nr:hypothetical protein AAVH_27744 [Aphelenchus avenae]